MLCFYRRSNTIQAKSDPPKDEDGDLSLHSVYNSIPDDVYDEIEDGQVTDGWPSRGPDDPQHMDDDGGYDLDDFQLAEKEQSKQPVDAEQTEIVDQKLITETDVDDGYDLDDFQLAEKEQSRQPVDEQIEIETST